MFPGHLEVGKYLALNFYALLQYYAISGICFFASCISNESKHSIGLGAGIPIAFVVLQMLGNSGEKISWISNLSLYRLFNPDKLFTGDAFAYISMLIFASLSLLLYSGGIAIFNKRDLPV
jgi:ABC-2 type transport system permease protein